MRIVCIKTLVMENGEQCFTEGKEYKSYKKLLKDGYEFKQVICANNDIHKQHVIKDSGLSKFYDIHFKEIK